MEIQYDGMIDDQIITDIVERVLTLYGVENNKKEISWHILEGIEDFFNENS